MKCQNRKKYEMWKDEKITNKTKQIVEQEKKNNTTKDDKCKISIVFSHWYDNVEWIENCQRVIQHEEFMLISWPKNGTKTNGILCTNNRFTRFVKINPEKRRT